MLALAWATLRGAASHDLARVRFTTALGLVLLATSGA
jgi:hypothetical protein